MSMTYNLTSMARGKALPTLLNPVQAYERFFAAGAAGAARKNFDVDTNLLDFLADDVKRLQKQLDGSEREKLGRYLQAFESMSNRQGKLGRCPSRSRRPRELTRRPARLPRRNRPHRRI